MDRPPREEQKPGVEFCAAGTGNIKKVGEVVERPKALSDIRGVTYIYGMFYRFGLIDVPKEVKEKKNDRGNKKQKKGREDMLEENIKFFRRL